MKESWLLSASQIANQPSTATCMKTVTFTDTAAVGSSVIAFLFWVGARVSGVDSNCWTGQSLWWWDSGNIRLVDTVESFTFFRLQQFAENFFFLSMRVNIDIQKIMIKLVIQFFFICLRAEAFVLLSEIQQLDIFDRWLWKLICCSFTSLISGNVCFLAFFKVIVFLLNLIILLNFYLNFVGVTIKGIRVLSELWKIIKLIISFFFLSRLSYYLLSLVVQAEKE